MHLNYLAFAVPLFSGLMLLEYYMSVKRELKSNFKFSETVANLNVGIVERLTDVFTTGLFYFFFEWIYKNFAIFSISPGWISWLLIFLITDLLWYWYHRFGHTVNLFWSVHVVHHQSEDFNYTVSARITIFQAAARCLFWSILPLIGFPPGMIALFLIIHGAYPFFTHTQLVGKLGWIEYLFVTPSHHRVHHASNPEYLDKNYGDILIIWDKIFGTFAREDAPPVYGLTKPLKSHSFLWQHFHFMLEMLITFRVAKTFRSKMNVLFGRPDDVDPRAREYLERKLSQKREYATLNSKCVAYVRCQTISLMVVLFFALLFEHYLNGVQLFAMTAFIIVSVVATGAVLEQKRWLFRLEATRVILLAANIWLIYPNAVLGFCLLSSTILFSIYYDTLSSKYSRNLLAATAQA